MSLKETNRSDRIVEFELKGVAATRQLGRILAESLDRGAIISLSGNLGAGKTTFVQAIGKALGINEVISSPTFTMMNEYHSGRLPLYHFDFYRVMEMAERQEEDLSLDLVASEFDEICESARALMMIEWPEYFRVDGVNYLDPVDRLHITLATDKSEGAADDTRVLTITATGPNSKSLLTGIRGNLGRFADNT